MADSILFKIINPKGTEEWADESDVNEAVEIFINGIEIIDTLRIIETPYVIAEDSDLELAGDYGHLTPDELYSNLSNDYKEAALLCCSGCGLSGCWSILVEIVKDDKYVYWKNFKHNHRNWRYNISYKFDKSDYENALKNLHNSI